MNISHVYKLSLLLLASACASTNDPLVGTWSMVSQMQGNAVEATMTLKRDENGAFVGNWNSRGSDMPLSEIVVDGDAIAFDRAIPGGQVMHFLGSFQSDALDGAWSGPFGDIPVVGTKSKSMEELASAPMPRSHHTRPIVEEDGRTLLWANDDEWFDVTDATIDPTTFNHGIGKDTIPSIDEPNFVRFDNPGIADAGITLETPVLGIMLEGEARAYPVNLMDRHEIVNDNFGEKAYAILW